MNPKQPENRGKILDYNTVTFPTRITQSRERTASAGESAMSKGTADLLKNTRLMSAAKKTAVGFTLKISETTAYGDSIIGDTFGILES